MKHFANLILALLASLYFAIQILCFIINQFDNECYGVSNSTDPELAKECEGKTGAWGDKSFHLLEFWATFAFNIVEILALFLSPKNLQTIFFSPTLLKMIIFSNIIVSFISAMLININMPVFEVWAHEIEYIDELGLAFIDVILLLAMIRKLAGVARKQKCDVATQACTTCVAMGVAIAQFCIFNFMGWGEEGFPAGEPEGEKFSHDLEFVFGSISSFITFWFCMDNALEAQERSKEIFEGKLFNLGVEVDVAPTDDEEDESG